MYILDMRIEWAQARSCALHWDKEKRLLPEEMRCVITYNTFGHAGPMAITLKCAF